MLGALLPAVEATGLGHSAAARAQLPLLLTRPAWPPCCSLAKALSDTERAVCHLMTGFVMMPQIKVRW